MENIKLQHLQLESLDVEQCTIPAMFLETLPRTLTALKLRANKRKALDKTIDVRRFKDLQSLYYSSSMGHAAQTLSEASGLLLPDSIEILSCPNNVNLRSIDFTKLPKLTELLVGDLVPLTFPDSLSLTLTKLSITVGRGWGKLDLTQFTNLITVEIGQCLEALTYAYRTSSKIVLELPTSIQSCQVMRCDLRSVDWKILKNLTSLQVHACTFGPDVAYELPKSIEMINIDCAPVGHFLYNDRTPHERWPQCDPIPALSLSHLRNLKTFYYVGTLFHRCVITLPPRLIDAYIKDAKLLSFASNFGEIRRHKYIDLVSCTCLDLSGIARIDHLIMKDCEMVGEVRGPQAIDTLYLDNTTIDLVRTFAFPKVRFLHANRPTFGHHATVFPKDLLNLWLHFPTPSTEPLDLSLCRDLRSLFIDPGTIGDSIWNIILPRTCETIILNNMNLGEVPFSNCEISALYLSNARLSGPLMLPNSLETLHLLDVVGIQRFDVEQLVHLEQFTYRRANEVSTSREDTLTLNLPPKLKRLYLQKAWLYGVQGLPREMDIILLDQCTFLGPFFQQLSKLFTSQPCQIGHFSILNCHFTEKDPVIDLSDLHVVTALTVRCADESCVVRLPKSSRRRPPRIHLQGVTVPADDLHNVVEACKVLGQIPPTMVIGGAQVPSIMCRLYAVKE